MKIELAQEYRTFEFLSPWENLNKKFYEKDN
jgi:hypothetical protein